LVGHDKPSTKLLTRMFHEWPTATTDMAVLPSVLGCSFDRLPATGLPETISGQAGQAGQAHPATYRSGTPRIQSRGTAGRLPGGTPRLHGLAAAIHETSGLRFSTTVKS
jgi:hypothetical protein